MCNTTEMEIITSQRIKKSRILPILEKSSNFNQWKESGTNPNAMSSTTVLPVHVAPPSTSVVTTVDV